MRTVCITALLPQMVTQESGLRGSCLVCRSSISGVVYADDSLDQKLHWKTTIPLNIEPGHYVLRHEVVALHAAFEFNGAQHYPQVCSHANLSFYTFVADHQQCVNLEVMNSDGVDPCIAGADCRKGVELYDAYHPGLLINIYHGVPTYTMPGPLIWSGLDIPALREAISSTAPADPFATQDILGQCGGDRYEGPTKCPPGSDCVYVSRYYWHCSKPL